LQLLIPDISIFIHLELACLVETLSTLDHEFSVVDLLFDIHLRPHGGSQLLDLGVIVVELNDDLFSKAARLQKKQRGISLPEACALAYADANSRTLLSCDVHITGLAHSLGLRCHSLLWMLDEIHRSGIVAPADLHTALTEISSHPRSRLQEKEVRSRLRSYRR
jgi:hypothetical protein